MPDTPLDPEQALAQGRAVLDAEIDALARLRDRLNDSFAQAVQMVLDCAGKVVVSGVGKSGMAARKIAATLSSTGTPAVFLHAGEALHGDLGMVCSQDVLILVSHSGESDEIVRLLPSIEAIGPAVIALTGAPESRIAQAANLVLDCGVEREADQLNLAPTASAIAAQALGDALAVVVAARKQLTPERFALSHPGGALGRRLTVKVEHLMHAGNDQPLARPDAPMRDVVVEMTGKALGAVNIVDAQGKLVGIITDGDLRRALQRHDNVLALRAGDLMTKNPIRVAAGTMAIDALHLMEDRPSQIMVLPVVDDQGRAVGILRVHDIVKAGL
ncbi:MAG TPA: KpsF/GutQ family sugar-phosphate isomerase [Planctomycetota bacterium]|nr:KpsF/GutQ family sugar-phosphate isomerase [Planctomycetota bacterium]